MPYANCQWTMRLRLKVEHRGWNTENTESNSTQTPGKTSLPSQVDYEYWIYFRYSARFKQTGQGQAKYLANFNLDIRLNYSGSTGWIFIRIPSKLPQMLRVSLAPHSQGTRLHQHKLLKTINMKNVKIGIFDVFSSSSSLNFPEFFTKL